MTLIKWAVRRQKNNIMKSKHIFILCLTLLVGKLSIAQNAHFTNSGVIEYEKSVNMYAIIKKRITKENESFLQPAYEQFRKSQPQFKKQTSTLTFTDNQTLYVPKPDEGANNSFFNSAIVAQNNTIGTDLNKQTSSVQKKVYEETFLVKDSLRKINWKITDETREIAGFNCRRANALIMDSVYVVAFYTNEIAVSGGPESFTGLPGMILQVALPHENIIWLATKVTDMAIPLNKVAPPTKGKPVDNKKMRATLEEAMKDWGTYAQDEYKAYQL
jgi:GLPGLI family protein